MSAQVEFDRLRQERESGAAVTGPFDPLVDAWINGQPVDVAPEDETEPAVVSFD